DHRLGVEGDEECPDHALVTQHGARVHVPRASAETYQAATRLLPSKCRRHLGLRLSQHGTERGRGGLHGAHAVEEGQALLGLAELYEETLESGATAAREGRLRRLRESLAEHGG